MTEEYKEQLLNYVTGNLENTQPTTDEIFKEIVESSYDEWYDFIPHPYSDFHIEGVISSNENINNVGILYGGYYQNNDYTKGYGIIILVDENMKPIKTFFETDTGSKLNYIQRLEEDDENRYYAVSDTYFSYYTLDHNFPSIPTHTVQFLLLNNFTIQQNGEYALKIRNSYNFRDNNFYCHNMKKNPQSAKYVMLGTYLHKDGNNYYDGNTKCIDLTINVGSPNEWNVNTLTDKKIGVSFINFDNNSNYNYSMLYNSPNESGGAVSGMNTRFYKKNYDNTTIDRLVLQTNYFAYSIQNLYSNQAVYKDEDEIYFVLSNQDAVWPVGTERAFHFGFYKYNASTQQTMLLFERDYGISTSMNHIEDAIYVTTNQGKVYLEYNNNISLSGNTYISDYYIQRLENDTFNPILIEEGKYFVSFQRMIFVKNNFNLLQYYIMPSNLRRASFFMENVKEIYNSTQYNGEPYINNNVLSPLYVNLYSNGSLNFSRNLYNISKQNNLTMSSVEIPNNYLNDLDITDSDLISETNLQLINNQNAWTKNIYEVVDLNFLNTISIIDEDTGNSYLNSAIKVNNAITDGGSTNYTNTPCNKYRINYTDNTTEIHNIEWVRINNNNKEANISFYVEKDITSIDLISNDETTIYLTIPLNVTIGKYYNLKQKIRIGDKPTPIQLQYDNEDILYNNEPVMVYVRE